MLSYDALMRVINTKNSDLSMTFNEYSYQSTLYNYFGGNFTGFVEKQYYTDEEQNHFEKYFDAVGNLLQELKYSKETPSDASTEILITNYKYDSLYRLTKVQTPDSLFILYSYDGYGRQSRRITPDAGKTEYFYDKNNNLIYTQDENQKIVNPYKYTFKNYDGINRITGVGEVTYQDQDNPDDGSHGVLHLNIRPDPLH